MSNWKPLEVTPREVISYIDLLRCPMCKSKIANEGDPSFSTMDTQQEYVAWSSCIVEDCNYNIALSWNDPKLNLFVTDEDIEFEYQDKQYKIFKFYDGSNVYTEVKIYGLDELGHHDDEDPKCLSFNQSYFDFKKFNREKFEELIKTLLVFR